MRKLYRRYGFVIKIDFTFKLIREEITGEDEWGNKITKQFAVGFISGINPNNKIVIYGLCVTLQETKANTKTVFERFFRHMGS